MPQILIFLFFKTALFTQIAQQIQQTSVQHFHLNSSSPSAAYMRQ